MLIVDLELEVNDESTNRRKSMLTGILCFYVYVNEHDWVVLCCRQHERNECCCLATTDDYYLPTAWMCWRSLRVSPQRRCQERERTSFFHNAERCVTRKTA